MENLIENKRGRISNSNLEQLKSEAEKKNVLRDLLNKHKKYMVI